MNRREFMRSAAAAAADVVLNSELASAELAQGAKKMSLRPRAGWSFVNT